MSTYAGTTITDLEGLIDRFLPVTETSPGWLVLAHARTHLANKPMDEGDEDAWYVMGEIQECLLFGRDIICPECEGYGGVPPDSWSEYESIPCPRCNMRGRL